MSVPWWRGPMVGLDFEATGVSPENDRIVSAAVAHVGDGPTRLRTWLADPGVPIPDEATAIHGITTERVQAEGRPVADVVREVLGAIADRPAGVPLVIFNAPYDLTLLDRELRRHHGITIEGTTTVASVVDPFVVDKWLDRFRKGSRKLDAICAAYGATLDAAHEAESDALAACRAAFVLGARGMVIRNIRPYKRWEDLRELKALQAQWAEVQDDLERLHGAQMEWAHAEALRLADYFRSKGQHDDADGVRPGWPLVPALEREAA